MRLSFHPGYAVLTALFMLGIYMLSATPDYGSGGFINLVPKLLSKVLHVLIYSGLAWCLLKTFSGGTPGRTTFGSFRARRTRRFMKNLEYRMVNPEFGRPKDAASETSSFGIRSSIFDISATASCQPPPASCPLIVASSSLPAASLMQLYSLVALLAAAYAASDEWHQSFVVGRTASFSDVLLDCVGIAGLLLVHLLSRRPGVPSLTPSPQPSKFAVRRSKSESQ